MRMNASTITVDASQSTQKVFYELIFVLDRMLIADQTYWEES